MAYRVHNVSANAIVLRHGAALKPGESRPVHHISDHELTLQRAGKIRIDRTPSEDPNMDDARYVEVINPYLGVGDILSPDRVGVINVDAPEPGTWYKVSDRIPDIRAWKLQLRRALPAAAFDYKYEAADTPTTPFVSCIAREVITASTDFPELYVRCVEFPNQVIELEYWLSRE